MANPSTLYRFRIELSDVDRALYETLDFRVAMHPSETTDYLLSRVFAYVLNFEGGLEIAPGLCAADEPALSTPGAQGGVGLWIEIGNPSARRLHKASKAADRVRVYTYKNPENLKREAAGESIHQAERIEVFSLEPAFLKDLASHLGKDNRWTLIHNEGELVVTIGEETFLGTLGAHRLA